MNDIFKRMLKFSSIFIPLLTIMLYTSANSLAQDKEAGLEEMFAIFTEEQIVVSALKRPRTVSKSPAIMSVITAKQIKQLGFRTLMDALKTVPGFDIHMAVAGEKEFLVRGVGFSPKVKVMIDGHAIKTWDGAAVWTFGDLVVENIKRIEIIRGPGSALYGMNAFLAVVNVITKDIEDIEGFQLTASGGSFDTQNYNILFGKEYKDLEISGFLDYFDTEGFSKKIEQDILFPASFSKSPGRAQTEKEKTDLNLKLSYKNLEIKGKYMKKRWEDYIGLADALNDETELKDTYIFSDILYKLALGEKLNITPRIYYDQYNYDPFIQTRPNGFVATVDTPFGPFPIVPGGIAARARFKYRTIGFENQFNYNIFKGNELTFGFQFEWTKLHDVKYSTNFIPTTPVPPSLTCGFF